MGLPTGGLPTAGLPTAGLPTAGLPTVGLPTSGLPTVGLPTGGLPTAFLLPYIRCTMKTEKHYEKFFMMIYSYLFILQLTDAPSYRWFLGGASGKEPACQCR